MTARHALMILAALLAVAPLGCRRPISPAPSPATPMVPTPAETALDVPPEPDRIDYRMLSKAELEDLIRTKTGSPMVTLIQKAPNRYTGRIAAPDGTPLPVEVTVEAEQIICDTNTPDGSVRNIITPRGIDSKWGGG